MKGKHYFFVCLQASQEEIDIKETEFDDYQWLPYNEALTLTEQIYQKGKKRITLRVIKLLQKQGIL